MSYKKVKEFNVEVLGIIDRPITILSFDEVEISYISLHEEADEFIEAYQDNNMVGMVDACVDSIYFAMGVLHKMGISEDQFEKIFGVVHKANMQKTFGTNAKRDTGAADAVKPSDWIPPEQQIKEILEESETKH